MQNTQIATIIKELCDSKGVTISALLLACNLTKSFMYDLEKRNTSPSCNKISHIADYLDCSVDYLLGRSNTPERFGTSNSNYINNNGAINAHTLAQNCGQGTQTVQETAPSDSPSKECAELVKIYTSLPFPQQVRLLNVALELKEETSDG